MIHELPVLRELTLLAGCSLAVILLFRRLRLPPVLGFLVTGIALGPGGLALVHDPQTVSTLAEIGVVLLLFTIGLEFSLADLRRLGGRSALAGALQVLFTAALAAAACALAGVGPARAVFAGFLLAPSSTALVFRLVTDRGELQSPHGRLLTAVLLVQDLAVVPMAMLVPVLSGGGPAASPGGVMRAIFLIGAVAIAFQAARSVLPWVLARASRGRSRETFLAAVVFIVLGSAFLSEQAGLSLSLGAFLAGLILAESDLRSQVVAVILPFRDTFSSVFFLSIGMLLSPAAVLAQPGLLAVLLLAMVLGKLVIAAAAARAAGVRARTAFAAGLGLAHVGEFSFVLAQAAHGTPLLPQDWYNAFIAAAVFSMMLTPWLVGEAPEWSLALERFVRARGGAGGGPAGIAAAGAPEGAEAGAEAAAERTRRSHHVVIAGFGLNGQNLARVLRATHIAHVVVDLAPEALARCAAEGSEGLLGDVTQPEILRAAGIERARVLVLALSDPIASRHAARLARAAHRGVFILARTHAVSEIDELHRAGADLVIPEEFETSIEIFSAVLREYHVPNNVIDAQILLLRQERYSLLRGLRLPRTVEEQLQLALLRGTTETVVLLPRSPAVGRTLADTGLGAEVPGAGSVRLIAVVRGGGPMTALDPQLELRVGDTLVVTGTHAGIDQLMDRLAPPFSADAATPR